MVAYSLALNEVILAKATKDQMPHQLQLKYYPLSLKSTRFQPGLLQPIVLQKLNDRIVQRELLKLKASHPQFDSHHLFAQCNSSEIEAMRDGRAVNIYSPNQQAGDTLQHQNSWSLIESINSIRSVPRKNPLLVSFGELLHDGRDAILSQSRDIPRLPPTATQLTPYTKQQALLKQIIAPKNQASASKYLTVSNPSLYNRPNLSGSQDDKQGRGKLSMYSSFYMGSQSPDIKASKINRRR